MTEIDGDWRTNEASGVGGVGARKLERRYLQARKELDEQFKRERASVSGLGKRGESVGPRYNDGASDEVGNKGLEPLTSTV
ncbi:hypothetical protein BLEM_1806 [Bifidobacterium lemurum]|uniref:Uncharacterized protein n=1 Tax=Bifidobacterium lemurum TaxID=1603886 RepID=A0A261FNE0_9BIFI|nr:hypothetical protein BLEM_1806 [Bifidobacterium lemurum]